MFFFIVNSTIEGGMLKYVFSQASKVRIEVSVEVVVFHLIQIAKENKNSLHSTKGR